MFFPIIVVCPLSISENNNAIPQRANLNTNITGLKLKYKLTDYRTITFNCTTGPNQTNMLFSKSRMSCPSSL